MRQGKRNRGGLFLIGLVMGMFLSSCSEFRDEQASFLQRPTLATTVTTPLPQPNSPTIAPPTATVTPQPTATPTPWRIGIDSSVPAALLLPIDRLPADQFEVIDSESNTELNLNLNKGETIAEYIYAAVAPFPTIKDDVLITELQQAELYATAETAAVWQTIYPNLQIVEKDKLVETLWANRNAFAIVPFDALTPDLKVMHLEGQSPLDRELDLASYPLVLRVGASGDEVAIAKLRQALGPITNRDTEKMTKIAMTGVTALVRATAAQMEYSGILFPGEVVGPILQSADVAHISNEVPFAENCPFPNAVSASVVFCSRDSYFELLEYLGADVIEVTGNHSNDYGTDAMLRSLDKYLEAGMNYYGGGRDLNDSFQPAFVYDHGNKIAFIGCNSFGPYAAWATADLPGTAPCGDMSKMTEEIGLLAAEGYVVIATFQYEEIYSYQATPNQQRDYRLLAEAGAAAVSGSQSHHPQAFDFKDGAYIHYGLGNLFFDQMNSLGTRQMFIDNYIVYDGRLISVELWTGLIEYYSRPREMTPAEREALLNSVFRASGW